MSSLVIAGDTSGSVTLQAPAISGSTVLTLPSTTGTIVTASGTATAGGVAYGNGTTAAYSAAGTAGQYLQSNGSSAPTWSTPAAGALILLSTVTASASATVDVENTFSSTYDVYELIASGVVPANDGEQFRMTMKIGGVYVTGSGYRYVRTGSLSTSSSYVGGNNNGDGAIILGINVQNGASVPINFKLRIYNPSSTALQKAVTWEGYYQDTSTPAVAMSFGAGSNNGTDALTGIRFFMGTGNITSGTFRLYGIANS
jgi:hypothetical protein